MLQPNITKAFLICVIATTAIFACYESWLRHQRYIISYDDDGGELFADIRRKIYLPQEKATVFLGSSRMKFDLDISTWAQLTQETGVMLANVGSSPLLILKDLADDEKFSGKVLIDITEGSFFDLSGRSNRRPSEKLDYYKKETIAQRWSFFVNDVLESKLIFLDKENFSLSSMLKKIDMPKREGKTEFPPYPVDFGRVDRNRRETMEINFTSDTAQINQMKNVWLSTMKANEKRAETPQTQIDSIIHIAVESIKKIEKRNGKVFFIRPPSSGTLREMEVAYFPRQKYWDRILELTGVRGIHYEDHPTLRNFTCVEMSHLSKENSRLYTTLLIDLLRKEQFLK
jgi:hypothetical protein